MKKILLLAMCFILLIPTMTSAMVNVENQDLNPNSYHAQWHSQSGHLTLNPLEITTVWVKFKNTGSTSWYNYGEHPVRIGTSHDIDRNSQFYKHTWLSNNRASNLKETEVKPDSYGTFEFYLKAPENPGIYREYFQPVIEGITWMEDWGVYWEIAVEGEVDNSEDNNMQYDTQEGYHAAFDSQSSERITINSNEYQTVWVKFKNTGSKTWYNYGNNPVHLGTDNPRDRNSGFYKNTWLAANRSANLKETQVNPGQIGNFEFYVKAPNEPGEHYEYFTPVVENLSWIGSNGVYWIFDVPGDTNSPNDAFELTGTINNGQVNLNWNQYTVNTQTNTNDISGYKIVRSESNANPTYPDDWWVYLSSQRSTSYTDTSVIPGHSYYYRVGAYISGTGVIEYSNNIFLSIPANQDQNPEDNGGFTLTGTSQSNGILLDWNKYINTLTANTGNIEGYKIVRSITTSSPTYPEHYLVFVSGQENTEYLDTSVDTGQDYYYRIGAYQNGQIIDYSNAIRIEFSGTN